MYYWTRRCPQCGRELRKTSLAETLKCLCNWQWGNDVSKDSTFERIGIRN